MILWEREPETGSKLLITAPHSAGLSAQTFTQLGRGPGQQHGVTGADKLRR